MAHSTIAITILLQIEEDYEWITTRLVRIANNTCNGRVVSVLEGGYQLGGEYCSAFAKSVKAHVAALATEGSKNVPYDQHEEDTEASIEKEVRVASGATRIEYDSTVDCVSR